MFIRYSTQRSNGKTYRYPQLVESYRRADGRPVHRVLCSLSSLSEETLANVAAALEAGRQGERLVVAPDAAAVLDSVGVLANLRYLDIAVFLETWGQLRLDSLLAELLGGEQLDVAHQDVVCALAAHRCTDPGSKLAAVRWYPKTALPELQHIAPAHLHNTRVHRTLEALESIDAKLQARLAEQLCADQGRFAALFMDITDTWFEGRGPQMAYNAVTKEGMVRRKIGLVLLCDPRGYPLRWKALPGNYYEADAMAKLVEEISTLDWVQQVPIVLDRMMGKAGTLAQLSNSGVRFVTALPASEFESWTADIPWQPLAEVIVAGTDSSEKEDLARAQAAVKRTAMVKGPDRWLLDLGVVTRVDIGEPRAQAAGTGAMAEALRLATSMKADLDTGACDQAELAQRKGMSTRGVQRYLKLTGLAPQMRSRVLAGEAETLSLKALASIASHPAKEQTARFDALLKQAGPTRIGRPPVAGKPPSGRGPGVSVRLVVGFRPEALVAARREALETRRELDAYVEDLNRDRRLRSPHSHRDEASILAEMDRVLRAKKWLGLFKVVVEKDASGHSQVTLQRDEQAWARRARFDGFSVYAAHPDLPMAAPAVVDTYFSKDAVEKIFQTIKSELELRPVRHRTDLKVRAHVTICMLALLVERQLELRLKGAGVQMTASALLEALSSVHLNRLRIGNRTTHVVTECDPDTTALVTALGMKHLVDNDVVAQRIQPRAPSTL